MKCGMIFLPCGLHSVIKCMENIRMAMTTFPACLHHCHSFIAGYCFINVRLHKQLVGEWRERVTWHRWTRSATCGDCPIPHKMFHGHLAAMYERCQFSQDEQVRICSWEAIPRAFKAAHWKPSPGGVGYTWARKKSQKFLFFVLIHESWSPC